MLFQTRQKTNKQLRHFGFVMAGAWTALGIFFLWKNPPLSPYLFGLAVPFLLAGLFVPMWLRPVEFAWMKLAEKLAIVSTTIILTLVFFLIITPIGLIIRRKDLLAIKKAPERNSFWVAVDPEGPASRVDKPF